MRTKVTVTHVYEEGDPLYGYFPDNTVQVSYNGNFPGNTVQISYNVELSESREFDEIRDESGELLELVPSKTSFLVWGMAEAIDG